VLEVRHSLYIFAERAREGVVSPLRRATYHDGLWLFETTRRSSSAAAMLLLRELGPALSVRVAVLDPCPPPEKPTVHWSYWSHVPTLYDRFAVGSWRKARVAQMPAEPVAPYILRLARSTDVFAHIAEELRTAPVEWLRASASSVERGEDGTYEVNTDAGAVRAGWVFDRKRSFSVSSLEPGKRSSDTFQGSSCVTIRLPSRFPSSLYLFFPASPPAL
jgi:hypothetical protein